MASPERKSHVDLSALLSAEGKSFDFFRAVQVLQRLAPNTVPVGHLGPPESEAIRFAHAPDLSFSASDIDKIEPRVVRAGRVYARITSTFLGLFGSASPLANYMSEDLLRAEAADNTSVRAFYDLFHHRVLSLFFRAWKKHRFSAGFRVDATDSFSRRAVSFVGVDLHGAVPKHGLPPGDLLALAPLVSQRTRPARTLQIILERLLPGTRVAIESFVPRRVVLDHTQRALLGVQNSTLGVDFTIGRSVLDRSGAFRVVVGPVSYEAYESFAPGGRHHGTLRKIVNQFSGGTLEAELELRLSEDQSPRFQLGSKRGATLGLTTQLITKRKGAMRVRIRMSDDPELSKPQVVPEGEAAELASAEPAPAMVVNG